jgi:hypothetical protein
VVAVARKVADRHLGVRNMRLDQPLDVICLHRHCGFPFIYGSARPSIGLWPAFDFAQKVSGFCNHTPDR